MLVTAGDSAADPVPVVIQTPHGLVAAPRVTGRPIGTGQAHRTVLPYPAPGPMRRARLVTMPGRDSATGLPGTGRPFSSRPVGEQVFSRAWAG
jgi:hypothetical protein